MRKSFICVWWNRADDCIVAGYSAAETDRHLNRKPILKQKDLFFSEHLSDYGFFKGNLKDLVRQQALSGMN